MAKGYQLIQAQTLTGAAASVTFTNIPQNFTDLIISVSARAVNSGAQNILVSFNGSSANFSSRLLYGTGSSVASISYPANTPTNSSIVLGGSDYTANTFNSGEIYLPNYAGSINKSFFSDSVTENNATASYIELFSHLWSSTAAINSVGLAPASGNFATNSTFTLYGVGGTRATGGTITSDGKFTYHTFTSSNTFTALEKIKGAEVLMVAGGGGGGIALSQAGGGGAGGVVYSPGQTLIAGTSYTCLVGAGGLGGVYVGAPTYYTTYSSGNTSNFGSVTAAVGGGYGGVGGGTGINGGSGGGGSQGQLGGGGTAGQGNNGGNGSSSGTNYSSGGGGGAGAAGSNGSNSVGGDGGIGTSAYSSWGLATGTGQLSSGIYYYAGGGGGGGYNISGGAGGLGGGSAGGRRGFSTADNIAPNATANTGGGGGGSADAGTQSNGTRVGGNGGSGLVIIRYPNY